MVVEQAGRDPRRARRARARPAVPRHPLARDGGRRAGPARAGVRARTTPTAGASTSTTPTAARGRSSSSTGAARARTSPTPARRAPSCAMADPESNHNGGSMAFGPDGLLYIGTGDGGGADDQHGSARATPRTSARRSARSCASTRAPPADGRTRIPAGNPFVGRAGARREIYAYGLRNPWRFSFDRRTGDIAIGDVGQNAVEEIDFARRGRARGVNYGWRPWEGTAAQLPRARAAARSSRSSPSATATAGARSPAATSCATRRSRSSRGQLRLRRLLQGAAARGDRCAPVTRDKRPRAAAAERAEPLVVRRGRARARVRREPRRPGLPHRLALSQALRAASRRARARARHGVAAVSGAVRSASSARSRSRAMSAASGTTSASA